MLFCTWSFAQFFVLVFALYWFIPWRRLRWNVPLPRGRRFTLTGDEARVWLLLGASFHYYVSWSQWLAIIIVVSTLFDYCIGLGLEAWQRPSLRRGLLSLSIIGNLTLLCYFKYVNFFLASLDEMLIAAGARGWFNTLHILVPIGISYYTFEAINYTVDVYRRQVPAERNPAHLLFFVLFFPHMLAGPIVRAKDFLPQIRRSKRWSWARFQLGGEYFLLGMLKKWVVADQLGLYADQVFADPSAFGTAANWIALLAFCVEVYCDFSGYSDMALGLAHLLGYKLAINFNMPYLATSVSNYWRRDHISLSTWLRDYLFIPLGGSRGSSWQTCRNFIITMVLGGLWHGASWNFALWGFLHGIFLSVHRWFRSFCEARPRLEVFMQSLLGTILRRALTLFCIYQCFVHFLLLAIGIALSTAFIPACGPAPQAPGRVSWAEQLVPKDHGVPVSPLHFVPASGPAPQAPGRVSWAEQLVQKDHNVPVSRLHIADSRRVGGREKPVALVEAEYTYLDPHGEEKKARTKLYLPDKLRTDPRAKVPLYYLAGYEVTDQVALSHVQRGWVVVSPAQVKAHPMVLTANPDRALLHIARSLLFVDDAKVVIGGGSAGGYMTLLLAAETFPLAGAVADVTPMNWGYNGAYLLKQYGKAVAASIAGEGREMPFLTTVTTFLLGAKQLYGTEYGDLLWFRNSPLCHLSTITCPVSALWSTADVLVPMQQIGDRWVRPFDPKEFPEGFTMDPARLTATREGRLRLTDVLADEEYEVFTVPVPDTVPPDKSIELPVSARKRWTVTILDEGPPQPSVGHFKHTLTVAREEFFRRIMSGSPPTSQLTPRKLERLMDRYAGKEWLPTKLKDLDYAESERADVLRGLRTYVTACPENAQTFARLYRQLPSAKRVLEPELVAAAPAAASKPR